MLRLIFLIAIIEKGISLKFDKNLKKKFNNVLRYCFMFFSLLKNRGGAPTVGGYKHHLDKIGDFDGASIRTTKLAIRGLSFGKFVKKVSFSPFFQKVSKMFLKFT